MSTKLTDLAKQLDISTKQLREKLKELGFGVKSTARTVDDEVADLILAELSADLDKDKDDSSEYLKSEAASADTVEVYDEMFAQKRDREIVKSQRKQTAGTAKRKKSSKLEVAQTEPVAKGVIEIPHIITVKEFSEKTGVNPAKIIGELMKNGILANINQQIDYDTAQILATDLKLTIKKKRGDVSLEDVYRGNLTALLKEDEPEDLEPRPPIVTVMGHIDHGKTKLLDTIRQANVIEGESGGITQHIAAYQTEKKGRLITFLDTPGHEAFAAMRARGAKVTDVAILVVAADEGVKPQTIEAINHAKEAGVPIVVAMNKIDKENIHPDRVKGELSEHGLQPEDWGGDTPIVPLSALTGQGVDDLLDVILLIADMNSLQANPNRSAIATVIESHLDKSLGPVATIVVNTGTLRLMDNVVVGSVYGRIKLMKDHKGKSVKKAGPSKPVFIAGLSATPQSGDLLQVTLDEKSARQRAIQMKALHEAEQREQLGAGLNEIISQIQKGKLRTLKVVLKADAQGSLEAIMQSLAKVKNDDVAIKIIHSGVGNVNESDVMMASASGGLVIGFHVTVSQQVRRTAERMKIEIGIYSVIYDLIENLKNLLSGLLEPEVIEQFLGRARVKQIFFTKKNTMIVGCSVQSGKIQNKAQVRVWRGEENIGEGEIIELKNVDKVVKDIGEGNECGIKFLGNVTLEEGDILEGYKIERKKRTL